MEGQPEGRADPVSGAGRSGGGADPRLGQPGQTLPIPRRRRWYHVFLRHRPRLGQNPGTSSTAGFAIMVILAAIASGLIAFWIQGGPGWLLLAGGIGLLLSAILLYVITYSLERRLWAGFFSFMAGAAASLTAPAFSFEMTAEIINGGGRASGSGALASGGSGYATLLWLAGAIICGIFALLQRR